LALGKIQIEVIMTTFFGKEVITRVVRVKPEGMEREIAFSDALYPSGE
jgi:hypothetical protein